jgi:hypothetical protein
MKTKPVFIVSLLVTLSVLSFSQSRETGAILGKVTDDQKDPLLGATVTLTGKKLMGTREVITDVRGDFRFPALPPGEYSVMAVLQGFRTTVQDNIRLTTTISLTVDMVMSPATVAEEVTVKAEAPVVDLASTETGSVTLADEILRNIPTSSAWPATDLVNQAPGVCGDVAYGASQAAGIVYTLDGVMVGDPGVGGTWVLVDYNIIEEAKVMGVGLPAEYGNFSGVIYNVVTKTGGNTLSGHAEIGFQGDKKAGAKSFWQAENNGAYLNDFPGLTPPRMKMLDISAHLGGPIIKDRLWFYTGLQWREDWTYPAGFPDATDVRSPHFFGKLTAAPSKTLTLAGFLELDTWDVDNRFASSTVSPEATVTQRSPEIVGNFTLTKILNAKTFVDVKAAYFWGSVQMDPAAGKDANAHYELTNNAFRTGSSGFFLYLDRTRLQTNASLTHYAEDFISGSHDFKFGVELEHATAHDHFGYTGQDNMQYWDYSGVNYLAYQYAGYDTDTRYTRLEAFAQDGWQLTGRLNLGLGVRFSQNWGTIKDVDGVVYRSTRLAPRLGLTYDLLGDKSTVLKLHYGQFTDGMFTSFHSRLNPASAYKDFIKYRWDNGWVEFDRVVHQNLYTLDPNIKHPYLNQFTVGLEREILHDTSFSVTYIYRDWKNLWGTVDTKANYEPISITVPEQNNKVYTIYDRTSGSDHAYFITNIKQGSSRWVLGVPYRRYGGLEIMFNKRFSNRWQLLASYVFSKARGTMDNTYQSTWLTSLDNMAPDDPNYWLNADGNLTIDPTHQIKIQGSYIIPVINVALNAYYHAITGNSWTTRYATAPLGQGIVSFFIEPRGSHHYPMASLLDLRLEKIFTLAGRYRLGLIFDVFNIFNNDSVAGAGYEAGWGTTYGFGATWLPAVTYPSTDGHTLYSIVQPRSARLGVRFTF